MPSWHPLSGPLVCGVTSFLGNRHARGGSTCSQKLATPVEKVSLIVVLPPCFQAGASPGQEKLLIGYVPRQCGQGECLRAGENPVLPRLRAGERVSEEHWDAVTQRKEGKLGKKKKKNPNYSCALKGIHRAQGGLDAEGPGINRVSANWAVLRLWPRLWALTLGPDLASGA